MAAITNNFGPLAHLDKTGSLIKPPKIGLMGRLWRRVSGDKVYKAYQGHLKLVQAGQANETTQEKSESRGSFGSGEYRKTGFKALLKFAEISESRVEFICKYMDLIFVFDGGGNKKQEFNRFFFLGKLDSEKETLEYAKFEEVMKAHKELLSHAVWDLREKISDNISSKKASGKELHKAKAELKQKILGFLEDIKKAGLHPIKESELPNVQSSKSAAVPVRKKIEKEEIKISQEGDPHPIIFRIKDSYKNFIRTLVGDRKTLPPRNIKV